MTFLAGRRRSWADELPDDFAWGPSGSVPRLAWTTLNKNLWESRETAMPTSKAMDPGSSEKCEVLLDGPRPGLQLAPPVASARSAMRSGKLPLGWFHRVPVWKRTRTSVSDVEVAPRGVCGDCSVDEEMRRGRGHSGSTAKGTTNSRCQIW